MPPARPRRILQVDADAFFVQVARLADPQGAGRAELLLVGGSPSRRGVVTSASYAARAYGAHSAMPMARALRLCPQAMVVPVPRKLCGEKSRAIVAVLRRFTPVVQPASIDEMYLDLTGTEGLYHQEPLEMTARRIRETVEGETAIAVSIGGGTNKLIAKLAAGRAKPHRTPDADGVVIVPPGEEAAFLATHDLADIPGVGPRFQERLTQLGMRTVRDALAHERAALRRMLGERAGAWLYARIRGMDTSEVAARERAKSISRDETFAEDLATDDELTAQLLRLADRAAADLRAGGHAARTVTVRIRDFDFTTRSASRTLPRPVISDRAIFETARALLIGLRAKRHVPARYVSVALSGLGDEGDADQLALFEESEGALESERDRRLSRTLDAVRGKFGPDALRRGG